MREAETTSPWPGKQRQRRAGNDDRYGDGTVG